MVVVSLCRRVCGLRVEGVRADRQQEKERTQYIFALGNPSDGFDTKRVQRKQRSDGGASPMCLGKGPQQKEEQDDIGDVECQANEMMRAGAQAEELAVEHVGQPCERVPIARVSGCECPRYAIPGQAGLDVGIGGDVITIVVVYKVVVSDGPKENKGKQGEDDGDQAGGES